MMLKHGDDKRHVKKFQQLGDGKDIQRQWSCFFLNQRPKCENT